MAARFFNPWIGDKYWDGLGANEFRVLVLGASVYCTHNPDCEHYEQCTSGEDQDSSEYNDYCPFPEEDEDGDDALLEDYPSSCIRSPIMNRFRNKMEEDFGHLFEDADFWDCFAFTEYVQYFLDHQNTNPDDLSDRDMDAFTETLDELSPHVVVVFGRVVANALRDSDYTVDSHDGSPWDFAWDYEGQLIRFVCCTHPAAKYGKFSNGFPVFSDKFERTIDDDE